METKRLFTLLQGGEASGEHVEYLAKLNECEKVLAGLSIDDGGRYGSWQQTYGNSDFTHEKKVQALMESSESLWRKYPFKFKALCEALRRG